MRAQVRTLALLATLILGLAAAPAARADAGYQAAPAAQVRLTRLPGPPPYRTQLDDSIYARSDCGPAVLAMSLAAYGLEHDLLELRELTHTYQGTWPAVRVGTALQHVAHVARDFGLQTDGLYDDEPDEAFHRWTAEEVAAQLQQGRLVIPLVRFGLLPGHQDTGVRWGHYILLYATEGDGFRYHDPAFRPVENGPARWISRDQLDQAMAPTYPPRQALALGA
jgi:hypothetical protein